MTRLEPYLGGNGITIERFLDVVVPSEGAMPGGRDAGVLEYLASLLGKGVPTQYGNLAEALNRAADQVHKKRFEALSLSEGTAVLESMLATASVELKASFRRVRADCFAGYYAHPKYRAGLGNGVWAAVGFRPQLRSGDMP